MQRDRMSFNGVDGRSGGYLLELDGEDLVRAACGEPVDRAALSDLKARRARGTTSHYGLKAGLDPSDLAQAGWGLVLPAARPDSPDLARHAAILEALQPLLDLRRAQATAQAELFRVYDGPKGYRPGETKQQFVARLGGGPGPVDPHRIPYYLLIVADPAEVPFRIQSQLGVQHAVGRLHFDALEEYDRYARSVVAAETGGLQVDRRLALFGATNPDDAATRSSTSHLIAPLARALGGGAPPSGWTLEQHVGDAATRAAFSDLLHRGAPPALLFAACHGLGYPLGDEEQLRNQGALLCQDWPGPVAWRGRPIPDAFRFGADGLSSDTNLLGTMAFLFACYGAGTPELDEFSKQAFTERAAIAPRPFLASLPKALLSRPRGGALAVIGHVDRAWGHSFLGATGTQSPTAAGQVAVFESALLALMGGARVGAAMEYFGERYAELASDLSVQLEERDHGAVVDDYELATMWTASNDARGYAIVGDPATRIPLAPSGAIPQARPSLPDPGAPEIRVGPVTPTATAATAPEAMPDAAGAPQAAPAEQYGILGRMLGTEPATPAESDKPSLTRDLLDRLGATLRSALDNATSLQVSTWVTSDLQQARYVDGRMEGAELRALTRIELDGDTVVCLPRVDGELDRELWEIHLQSVQQAQAARAELLQLLVSAATALGSLAR